MQRRDFLKSGAAGAAAYAAACLPVAARQTELRAYLGTYTEGTGSQGIYRCLFDGATGALRIEAVTTGARNPSFLAFHPDGGTLYAVEEVDDIGSGKSGGVVAYAIDRGTGGLRETSRAESGGAHPAHLSVRPDGRGLLVANYTGATVGALPLDGAGALAGPPRVVRHEWVGPARPGQDAPHPHSAYPVGNRVYVADLGLDRVFAYAWNDAGDALAAPPAASLSLRPGDGPRHIAFHPSGRFAFVINELSSSITSLELDAAGGGPRAVGNVSTLPPGFAGESFCADIHIHPNGRYLYGSNRGHDSIVVAEISEGTGQLRVVQHHPTGGSWPRNFALDPSGRFLLVENQRGNSIVTLAIDPPSGRLSDTGNVLRTPAPVCLLFAPGA